MSPKNNKDLKQNLFHFVVKIRWFWLERVMSYHADKLVIDRHTDTQADKIRQWQYSKAITGLG